LLGGAVADALGMPTEVGPSRKPGQSILEACGVERVTSYQDSPNSSFLRAGEYSDDTQQSICLAETYLEGMGGFDPLVFYGKLEEAVNGKMRGVGPSTRRVLMALARGRGASLLSGKAASRSPTNGGAMRIAPAALLFFWDLKRLAIEVEKVTTATHAHPRSLAGAQAIAFLNAMTLRRLWANAEGDVAKHKTEAARTRTAVAHWIRGVDPELAEWIARGRAEQGPGCLVIDTVPVVIAAACDAPSDYLAAVLDQVNSEGDTDTKAAMLGNLLGLRSGVRAIPEELLEGLENGTNGRDTIERLALRLLDLSLELWERARAGGGSV